jgi:hypothetical protein
MSTEPRPERLPPPVLPRRSHDVEAMIAAGFLAVVCGVRTVAALARLPAPVPADAAFALLIASVSAGWLALHAYDRPNRDGTP